MMTRTNHCDRPIVQLLDDEINELRREELESHLSECEFCQESLQHAAAPGAWWNDTQQMLSGHTLKSSGEGLDLLGHECGSDDDVPSLDFLQPTDDPRMLGRLGTYEIVGVIGCGGMGIVLKAFDGSLNRYVAIKVLSPGLATSGAARQRFVREARAAAAVVHDNVIAIYGVETESRFPYLVMPYANGESLQRRIDRKGKLETEEILRVGLQIARGLSEAHDQGLIHRDVKPANVLLPTDVERILLTDFGLARAVDDASLTRSGVIAGTPQYMSPEQAKGDPVDTRSDLFSLGSVLYAMAAGHPPFRAESAYGIIRRIVETEPTPIDQVDARVPSWLACLIAKLHEKDPGNRPESAALVADWLEMCLSHVQTGSQPIPAELQCSAQSRRPAMLGLAIAASLCLGIGLAASHWWTTQADAPEETVATAPLHSASDPLLVEVESEIEQLLQPYP